MSKRDDNKRFHNLMVTRSDATEEELNFSTGCVFLYVVAVVVAYVLYKLFT